MQTVRRSRLAWWIATFFCAGYGRPGPGTYGSVAACLLWLGAGRLVHGNDHTLALVTVAAAVVASLVGIPASTRVVRESGREDPGFVVIDEVAGQLIALIGLPAVWPAALLGLLFFRFFDITKPWPIRKLEALPEGTGIMLDDLAAGVLALVCGHVFLHFVRLSY